jgi:hypothetical protein
MKGVSMSGANIGITSASTFIMAEEATTIGGVTGTPMVTMTGGATSIRIIDLPGEFVIAIQARECLLRLRVRPTQRGIVFEDVRERASCTRKDHQGMIRCEGNAQAKQPSRQALAVEERIRRRAYELYVRQGLDGYITAELAMVLRDSLRPMQAEAESQCRRGSALP